MMHSHTMEFFTSFRDCCSYNSLKNFNQISPLVQTRLTQFYVAMCWYHIALAGGACVQLVWNMGVLLPILATLGCYFWLYIAPPYDINIAKWVPMVTALFLLEGASMVSIVKVTLPIDTRIFVLQMMGNAITFACFSGAAKLTTRRGFLYLGAFLSSSVLIFISLHFVTKIFEVDFAFSPYTSEIFDGEFAYFPFELYIGLLVVVGGTVVITQVFAHEIWIELFRQKLTKEEYYDEKLDSTTNKNAM